MDNLGGQVSHPVRAAQAGMWFAQRIAAPTRVYNVAQYVDVVGPLDTMKLAAAQLRVVSDAEPLRVHFAETDRGLRQIVSPTGDWHPRILDLSSASDPCAAALEWMTAETHRPVDLTGGRLYDAALIRVSDERHFWYQRAHHSVADGFSGPLLAQRASALYNATTTGHPVAPAELPGLAELAREEDGYRQSDRYARDRDFWLRHMTDLPEPISLSHQGIPVPERSLRDSGTLASDLADQIRAGSRAVRSTWSGLAITACAAYLHRLTGTDDVVIGMPVTGRVGKTMRQGVAMMSNIVPLRLRPRPGMTVAELTQEVSAAVRQAVVHQRYRYEDLRRDIGISESAERLFSCEINVMPFDDSLDLAGCTATFHNLANPNTEDLAFSLFGRPDDGAIRVDVDADARRFDADDLEGHRRRYTDLLTALADRPDRKLRDLALLDEREHALIQGWNATARPVPTATFPRLFAEQAARAPGNTAVSCGARRWTYAELNERANRLAHLLVARGIGPEDHVVSAMPRSAEAVLTLLAVLKARAGYVPVDPGHPADRVAGVIDAVRPRLVLGLRQDAERMADCGDLWLGLDDEAVAAELADQPTQDPPVENEPVADALGLAYAIFTSGSTGRPKGAMVHQRGMVNHLLAKVEDLELNDRSRVALNAPLTFDVSVWQMLAALLAGGCTQVIEGDAGQDALALFDSVAGTGVTCLEVVPSQMRAALDAWDAGVPCPELPQLQRFVVNGEVLPPALCRRWYERFPHAAIINAYGLTECSDDNAHAFIGAADTAGDARLPVGRALRNNRFYILGSDLKPMPVGVPGELFIAGTGVGRGYLDDPSRTAERYVPDPFSTEPGARMYRTGDGARYRPDGQLDFLGRRDHQVKVRGNRIELGEVEAALRSTAKVIDAVVTVRRSADVQRLIGYFIGDVTPEQVRAAVADIVPDYMVPAALVRLDTFPLNTNGKVDRKALPAPDFTAGSAGTAARTSAEAALCEVFAQTLGLPAVGIDNSFFDLGGDSIVSIQLISRARRAGYEFNARDVFQHPTVRALAAVAQPVEAAEREPVGTAIGPVPPTPVAQWLRTFGGPADTYHQSVLLRVPSGLDEQAVTAALGALLGHHDMLRARAVLGADREPLSLEVPEHFTQPAESYVYRCDSTGYDDATLNAVVKKEYTAAVNRLAPGDGTMVQLVLFDRGSEETGRLLMVVHHLVVDAVSWRILLPDLAAAYTAAAQGEEPDLDPVGTSFRGWAIGLNDPAALTARRRDELTQWQNIVSDARPLPCARPLDPRRDTFDRAVELDLAVAPETSAVVLTKIPELFHTQVQQVLLSALALAVEHRRAVQHEPSGAVLVDVEGHGRQDLVHGADVSRTVGWFTSLYPVRLAPRVRDWAAIWQGGDELGRVLKGMKEQFAAIPSDGTGYGLLRHLDEESRIILAPSPGPQLAFNYLGGLQGAPSLGDWSLAAGFGHGSGFGGGAEGAVPLAHVLAVDVHLTGGEGERAGSLVSRWRWAEDLLPEAYVRQLAHDWRRALEALALHAAHDNAGGRTPSDMPLIDIDQDEIDGFEALLAEDFGEDDHQEPETDQ
ncbi:non-ribosomal peptide synthetase [Streptomyces sp. ADI93-02]|uniref:non-ribosomal peptide synthetase n=1 Tax=Streptomyces sp. ADI93-02 TaxID=1522757 RepID=UPI000F554B71|nr:non-ribosomal peptide synthetase [Streptomyces sp. ADI93-02]RPK41079.1 Dimodular nonribosomal peptide synthase [Streptomyces sp. ADI93-02]